MDQQLLLDKLKDYGVGRRQLDDQLFSGDPPLPRLATFDDDDEELYHEIITSTCNVPGCAYASQSLLDYENHYNSAHRYTCGQCKKVLPSPHFLDLHVQENHDSFFSVMAERKPSYCCFIQECKEKFKNIEERLDHCVTEHKIPKDFRYDFRPKVKKNKVQNKTKTPRSSEQMELEKEGKPFAFNNSKQKGFLYTGKKFTNNKKAVHSNKEIDMMEIVNDLRDSLPEDTELNSK